MRECRLYLEFSRKFLYNIYEVRPMKIKTFTVGPAATNCYVVYDGSDAVVIDPGFEAERIDAFLKQKKLECRYILLTHGHFDHIIDVPGLKELTGAKVVISKPDADCLISPLRSLSTKVHLEQTPIEADFLAEEGSSFVAGEMEFRYLLTPGHTPGSAVILCGDAMFSGDTLFRDSCGRTDLPGGSFKQIMESLKRLYELGGDYKVYPGHDQATTLSREREFNLHMQEAVFGVDGGREPEFDEPEDDWDEELDDEGYPLIDPTEDFIP